MNQDWRVFRVRVLGAAVIAFFLGSIGGIVFDRAVLTDLVPPGNIPADAVPNFRLMAEAWNIIRRSYVDRDKVNPVSLTYGAVSGMVYALGDTGHSTFLSPESARRAEELTDNRLKGIGIRLRMTDGRVVIVAALADSPAEHAGLLPGEVILKANGRDMKGLPLSEAAGCISGPAGTTVTLVVHNPYTGRMRSVVLRRASITMHNVTWCRLPGTQVAHLHIARFSKGSAQYVREALAAINEQGLSGIILDLRNNPGGLVDEAVDIASQFLEAGNVLLKKDARGDITPVGVRTAGIAHRTPLVALIDGGTVSAAEIVAGALRDAHRAVLVGETTFGTGTMLQRFDLSGGATLMLAVEQWLTPAGHSIRNKGITPHITVSLPADVVPFLPGPHGVMTLEQLHAARDKQLLRAVDVLTRQARGERS